MKKFVISRIEKELMEINELNGIKTKSAIQLVINNMYIYNKLLEEFQDGDTKKVYILYQLNGQIFKQLKEFKVLPSAIKEMNDRPEEEGVDDFIQNLKNKIEKR